jgi:DNA-directed RNA polymerase specialized sigma24 family protein
MRVSVDDDGEQLKVIAAELGCSTQLVSLIQSRALKKLRRILEARGLELKDLIPDAVERHDCRVD